MRTTLDIDPDVLRTAKDLARRDGKTAGAVISELARRSLTQVPRSVERKNQRVRHGFRPFPKRGGVLTNDLIDKLREDDAY